MRLSHEPPEPPFIHPLSLALPLTLPFSLSLFAHPPLLPIASLALSSLAPPPRHLLLALRLTPVEDDWCDFTISCRSLPSTSTRGWGKARETPPRFPPSPPGHASVCQRPGPGPAAQGLQRLQAPSWAGRGAARRRGPRARPSLGRLGLLPSRFRHPPDGRRARPVSAVRSYISASLSLPTSDLSLASLLTAYARPSCLFPMAPSLRFQIRGPR